MKSVEDSNEQMKQPQLSHHHHQGHWHSCNSLNILKFKQHKVDQTHNARNVLLRPLIVWTTETPNTLTLIKMTPSELFGEGYFIFI